MDPPDAFTRHRPLLFGIAYRMLGSAMDAEDMVQEAFLRWQRAPGDEVQDPRAYLATVITRLCLDQLRSARARRETYAGPWLPEPVPDAGLAAEEQAALAESLSLAFLRLLEQLTPAERAAFLLHDVFDYDYAEIARILGLTQANCRQMVSRARARVRAGRPRFSASAEQHQRLLSSFLQASAAGDLDGLRRLLADDVTLWSDGGGKVVAARRPIYGPDRVARFLLGVLSKRPPGFTPRLGLVNGRAAVVAYVDGQPYSVLWLDVLDGRIQGLYNILNPEKLRAIPPIA